MMIKLPVVELKSSKELLIHLSKLFWAYRYVTTSFEFLK